jgi:endoglucanase
VRAFLLAALALLLTACNPPPPVNSGGHIPPELWQAFKQAYVHESGRVIDSGNRDISHSEGQGYAMLLAVAADDQASFQRIWQWTQDNLRRQQDVFFSWRWRPDATPHVDDPNNASDGELLIAWALSRAAARWSKSEYKQQALTLAQALRAKLIRPSVHGPVLLPGMDGFEHAESLTVNLSYWIFPAFSELNTLDPSPEWATLRETGIALIRQAQFGQAKLPPDWLKIDVNGSLSPAPGWPPRFSFDAMRIPLYACWANLDLAPLYAHVDVLWQHPGHPVWVNLESGELAPYPLSSGGRMILQFMQRCLNPGQAQPLPVTTELKDENYYSSVLTLLTYLAQSEREP